MTTKRLIPKSREEDVLHMLWVLLRTCESKAEGPDANYLDREEVAAGYRLLNDLGYTKHRPLWERTS